MSSAVIEGIDHAMRLSLLRWLTGYVAQPHPELGRPGAVCPFVKPSLAVDGIDFRAGDWKTDYESSQLEQIVKLAVAEYWTLPSTRGLRSLIVAIPELPEQHWHFVDEVHSRVKGDVVAQGLMIGQFHPGCRAPAAHNALFEVNRSPIPLFVIRRMALHDILFLNGEVEWFKAYRRRFDSAYAQGRVRDPHLVAAYASASAQCDDRPRDIRG